jgi:hypothetical protein
MPPCFKQINYRDWARPALRRVKWKRRKKQGPSVRERGQNHDRANDESEGHRDGDADAIGFCTHFGSAAVRSRTDDWSDRGQPARECVGVTSRTHGANYRAEDINEITMRGLPSRIYQSKAVESATGGRRAKPPPIPRAGLKGDRCAGTGKAQSRRSKRRLAPLNAFGGGARRAKSCMAPGPAAVTAQPAADESTNHQQCDPSAALT